MKTLYITWQNPQTRDWFVVGKLFKQDDEFVFQYTQGAKEDISNHFNPFESFPQLERIYVSDSIFPIFKNRLMPRSRADFPAYLQLLQLHENTSELEQLARNGAKVTDTLEIIPAPCYNNTTKKTSIDFFMHGLRHCGEDVHKKLSNLSTGDTLLPMEDYQNPRDANAIMLRLDDPHDGLTLRYVPRYLAQYVKNLRANNISHDFKVNGINLEAPIQFRMLCKLETVGDTEDLFSTQAQFRTITEFR